jgi:crossover junction endodeoxyribonuclease RusA
MPERTKRPEALIYDKLRMMVPLHPPTGNHYIKHTRDGRHYVTPAAVAWYQAVAVIARGMQVRGKEHAVEYTVYQGFNHRGDVDNYAKVILDGLVKGGVLATDSSVTSLHAHKKRDKLNPRTEIYVWRVK